MVDVDGNVMAMSDVARAVVASEPDVAVFCGDLTWGPSPEETWRLISLLRAAVGVPVFFVRGDRERSLAELRTTHGGGPTARDRWMLSHHADATIDAFETFSPTIALDIEALGPTRFCHGSPRSDKELVTPSTSDERMRALLEEVDE